jgi:hypothetical protein
MCHVLLDKEVRPLLNAVALVHFLRPRAGCLWHNRRFAKGRIGSAGASDFNPFGARRILSWWSLK